MKDISLSSLVDQERWHGFWPPSFSHAQIIYKDASCLRYNSVDPIGLVCGSWACNRPSVMIPAICWTQILMLGEIWN
uniref:Uncharacterized protein n=1 Tax=Arundo donax TaxID=35708 RepID=A0A0A9FN84_ARUDO